MGIQPSGVHETVPSADSTVNQYVRDVVGNKKDTAVTTASNTASAVGYLKGILGQSNVQTVPSADSSDNAYVRDVVGNKTDTAVSTADDVSSAMRYLKGILGQSSVQSAIDGVYVDSVNGVAGTVYPIGTPGMPVSNLVDALTIAVARKTKKLYLVNPADAFIAPSDMVGYTIIGTSNTSAEDGNYMVNLAANSKSFDKSSLYNLHLTGHMGGATYVENCYVAVFVAGTEATFKDCYIAAISHDNSARVDLVNCYGSIDYQALIDFNQPACVMRIYNYQGFLKFTNINTLADSIEIYGTATILLHPSCTNGRIYLFGDIVTDDLSGGTVVYDYRTNQIDTRFLQETVAATNVNGVTWKTLLNRDTIYRPVRICGFTVTKAGVWIGFVQVRLVDMNNTKIYPFKAQLVETTDFTSAVQFNFTLPVEVSALKGYKFQFRSSDAGDGAGETLALTSLDVMELS